MNRIKYCAFIVYFLSAACASECGPERYRAFQFADAEINTIFIRMLVDIGVQHEVDEDGTVTPSRQDICEFNETISVISEIYHPMYGFSLPITESVRSFTADLNDLEVEYRQFTLGDRTTFVFEDESTLDMAISLFHDRYRDQSAWELFEKKFGSSQNSNDAPPPTRPAL